jgi:hypothetical protein
MSIEPEAALVARSLWYPRAATAELRDELLPLPGLDQVRVQADWSALSRGTESLVFQGAVPDSEHERMRVPFQGGHFGFPVKYGYAVVGTVVDGPPAWRGRSVFVLHPHQSAFVVPTIAVVPVPATVPARRAVLAANMETALNALWDGGALPGSRIAVVGGGVVGALTAWLAARLPGTEVTLVDLRPERAALAQALGVGFALPDDAPSGCDLVFHASASAAGLGTALLAAGDESTVVELSWYGTRGVTAQLGGAFHSARLKLIASQVGRVAPAMRARWSLRQRMEKALELLTDERLDALLEPDIPFEQLPAQIANVLGPGAGALCQVVSYRAR